jgi:uncharacterized protein
MKNSDRYVFDTNVVISAVLFTSSVPGQAFAEALERGQVLVSLPLLQELSTTLSRKKFDRYLVQEDRDRFLAALIREAVLIEITETVQICRDPKDDKLLELVISGSADCLITGDDDLLVLHPFRGVSILTPAAFLSTLPVH